MEKAEYYNWRSNIQIVIFFLKVLGLWPAGDGTYKLDIYTVYTFIVVAIFGLIHVGCHAMNIYFVRDDLKSVIGITYVIMMEYLGTLKIYLVITNMSVLKKCMLMIESDWFQPKNRKQKLLIEPSIKIWKIICTSLFFTAGASNIFWMLYPLLDSSEKRRLPFAIWYPYDATHSPFYEFSYILQFLNTTYLLLAHFNVDALIAGFNVFIGCHFDLLKDDLKNVSKKRANKDVIDCVLHHHKLLR